MAGKQPFLSISLLSSGRIGTIERCLASLAPFKEKLDAEIIVVDTDPKHRADVHAILERYADRIIAFDWCDDFSAARNAGLSEAKGEWFLFIDDDEWFIVQSFLTDGMAQGAAEAGDPSYWNLVRAVAEADAGENAPWDVRILWADHAAEVNGIQGIMPQKNAELQTSPDKDGNGKQTDGRRNTTDDSMPEVADRDTFQGCFRSLFATMNPLLVSPEILKIGLRRGAILDERIREIPFGRWQSCVEGFVQTVADPRFALNIASVLEDVYLGLPDEHYRYFLARTEEMLAKAKTELGQETEARKKKEKRAAAQKEMKQIIDALQGKVNGLVSAGMIEEADEVLQEIQKYTDMMG